MARARDLVGLHPYRVFFCRISSLRRGYEPETVGIAGGKS